MRYKYLRFPNGKGKAVTMSYDDGCIHDKRFSDIITKYGIKATFNLNSKELHQQLSDDEIKSYMLDRGHEIAVHGAMHRANGVQRPIDGIKDVLDCRLELEDRFGMIIRGMAYPDSGITRFQNTASYDDINHYLKDLDIAYSRTLGGDNNSFALPTDWYAWMPTAHHNNPQIMDYIEEFLSIDLSPTTYCAGRQSRLFYIWGHSYEFDRNDNWEHLEKICDKLGKKDDIWYATNIEIYEYITAYNSLVYSADSSLIYNPTVKEIWFDIDGTTYSVKPDETLKIN